MSLILIYFLWHVFSDWRTNHYSLTKGMKSLCQLFCIFEALKDLHDFHVAEYQIEYLKTNTYYWESIFFPVKTLRNPGRSKQPNPRFEEYTCLWFFMWVHTSRKWCFYGIVVLCYYYSSIDNTRITNFELFFSHVRYDNDHNTFFHILNKRLLIHEGYITDMFLCGYSSVWDFFWQ